MPCAAPPPPLRGRGEGRGVEGSRTGIKGQNREERRGVGGSTGRMPSPDPPSLQKNTKSTISVMSWSARQPVCRGDHVTVAINSTHEPYFATVTRWAASGGGAVGAAVGSLGPPATHSPHPPARCPCLLILWRPTHHLKKIPSANFFQKV